MKPTNFAVYLTKFLGAYLPNEKGFSLNTIASYRDTFTLLLKFISEEHSMPAEKITLDDLSKELIKQFLDWLEESRSNSISTRNVRLAAIHSFFRYLQYEHPEKILEWQKILSIPIKKTLKPFVNYMSIDGIELLMKQPDTSKKSGRRDLALLALLYDSAARVQELINLTPNCIRFENPSSIKLTGKRNKVRVVPLMTPEAELLKSYMVEHQLLEPWANEYPLFFNNRKEILSRGGVSYILKKYIIKAQLENTTLIPEKFTPHCLRHSKSMHLLQAGVNLVYIRDILGHVSIQATEIYARADSKQKRLAIESAYSNTLPKKEPKWHNNSDLLKWLKSLC
jgi:site-specific recombinase XerD